MPAYSGNSYYVVLTHATLGSLNVSNYVRNVDFDPKSDAEEITAGNATFVSRAAKLRDTSMKMTIVNDPAIRALLLKMIKPGNTLTVDYGEEGNGTGSPRHKGDFLVMGGPHKTEVSKTLVAFDVSLDQAAPPTIDMHDGGVF